MFSCPYLTRLPVDEARAELAQGFAETDGNFCRVAHLFGISRKHLYRLVWRWDLWPAVDAARQAAVDSLVARRRALLGRRSKRDGRLHP